MDLIRIDDTKMKIMLTPLDMQGYDLDAADMSGADPLTQRAFRHILDDVRAQCGFDAGDNKLFVQCYPSREGGCELFVTKLGALCALGGELSGSSAKHSGAMTGQRSTDSDPGTQGLLRIERGKSMAFTFEKIEHLLTVCRHLSNRLYSGESAAYQGEEGRYYLLLTEQINGRRIPMIGRTSLSFIHEFGTRQNADAIRLYIREHGRPICETDAVSRLAQL